MGNIDKTKTILLIEAKNARAEEVFNSEDNEDYLVDDTEKPTLQLTLDKHPRDPSIGYVFGSNGKVCDVLLDAHNRGGVSTRAFAILNKPSTSAFEILALSVKGIYILSEQEDAENAAPTILKYMNKYALSAGESRVILHGNIRFALKSLTRDVSEQQSFDQNLELFNAFRNSYLLEKANPDIGQLDVQGSNMETPQTRVFTGLCDQYTTTNWAAQGDSARITTCVSKTGVTCCVKEAKAVGDNGTLGREIRILRKLAHPSIIRYIDRDQDFNWVVMEFASLGDLEQQHLLKPFKPEETELVVYQALHAISHMHGCGITHHDIKPENILVHIRNDQYTWIKIAGFGLSDKPVKARFGTVSYLAPEYFKGPPDSWKPKVDVWALAMVAMRFLFGIPPVEIVASSVGSQARSPYAEGSHGQHKIQVDGLLEQYKRETRDKIDPLLVDILRHMFVSDPDARISASEACESLREHKKPGYFLIRLKGRLPALIDPKWSNDDSIFRFRELDNTSLSQPPLMLEGCGLVNMGHIIEAITDRRHDIEETTYTLLKKYGSTCWRFKRTNALPERYFRIEDALTICEAKSHRLQPLVNALQEEKARLEEIGDSPEAEGNVGDDSGNAAPIISQIGLVESIPTSSHVIAITQNGRMLLVRARDGFIHSPSLAAAKGKRLLSKEEVLVDEYEHLRRAMYGQNLTHEDYFSLGAATYCSY